MRRDSAADGGLSVEDVMGMYASGFESDMEENGNGEALLGDADNDTHELDVGINPIENGASRPPSSHSTLSRVGIKMLEAMNDPLPIPRAVPIPGADQKRARETAAARRKSLLPSSLPKEIEFGQGLERMAGRRRKYRRRRRRSTTRRSSSTART